jgi:hypothetical protein
LRRTLRLNLPAILNQLKNEGFVAEPATSAVTPRNNHRTIGSRLRSLRLQRNESLSEKVGIMHRLARHYGRNVLRDETFSALPRPQVWYGITRSRY